MEIIFGVGKTSINPVASVNMYKKYKECTVYRAGYASGKLLFHNLYSAVNKTAKTWV